jgi:hypothetical protein
MSLKATLAAEKNPATKFIQWKSDQGYFYYYDKQAQKNVQLDEPIHIIVIDQLTTVKGYHEPTSKGIYANEVRYSAKQPLNVSTFGNFHIANGLYSEIKEKIKASGGKYSKSVYAALLKYADDGSAPTLELVNFQFYGAALEPYINAKIKTDGSVYELGTDPEPKKKGAVRYFVPTITKVSVKVLEETLQQAIDLNDKLDVYLNNKLDTAKPVEDETANLTEDDLNPDPSEVFIDSGEPVQMPY